MINLGLRCGGGQHDLLPGLVGARQQVARAMKWFSVMQVLALVNLSLPFAKRLYGALVQLWKQERHEHVATFADLIVNDLPVKLVAGIPKRLLPREHVQVVAVDKRAVDVEQNCFYCQSEVPLCCRRTPGDVEGSAEKLGLVPLKAGSGVDRD